MTTEYKTTPDSRHADIVRALSKTGEAILADMNPKKAHLLHMAVGVSGEAGELLDAIKKHVIYNKPLDCDNVIEELGDLEFYLRGIRQALVIGRTRILEANIAKLTERYGETYSNEAAQARKDKQA